MKIAVASNNGERVGQHFGRVRHFVVLTVEDGAVSAREVRDNVNRRHGTAAAAEHGHGDCFDAVSVISDCDALVVGGMGFGARAKFQAAGIRAVLTDERSVEEAALRLSRGELPHLEDRLHAGGGHHEAGSPPAQATT